jgi:2-dehydro-3-deoxygalactonokinase
VAEIRERLGDLPLLMAGMIGSNRGWVEAPYVPCPAGLPSLPRGLKWVEPADRDRARRLLSSARRADVMRGEEVQILGAFAEGWSPPTRSSATRHAQQMDPAGGRPDRQLPHGDDRRAVQPAAEHSILADLLSSRPARTRRSRGRAPRARKRRADGRAVLGPRPRAARQGAARGRRLLYQRPADRQPTPHRPRAAPEGEVVVMGRPELTSLFAAALAIAGRAQAREVDGERLSWPACRHLAELIQ